MLIFIAIGAFLVTLFGGWVALRFKDKLHLILGFSAGAVIAVAFFDLLPEALELAEGTYDASIITSLVAAGFLVYLILDRTIFLHTHDDETPVKRGIIGASSLSLHSLLDGVAIGLAFQASVSVGVVVAIAVLIHDFSDGVNTVGLILKNGGERKFAMKWLATDAVAPVIGIALTTFISVPSNILALILAVFCGFFLYIGATDLIPESHHAHPKFLTTFMTLLGAAVLYGAIKLAGI